MEWRMASRFGVWPAASYIDDACGSSRVSLSKGTHWIVCIRTEHGQLCNYAECLRAWRLYKQGHGAEAMRGPAYRRLYIHTYIPTCIHWLSSGVNTINGISHIYIYIYLWRTSGRSFNSFHSGRFRHRLQYTYRIYVWNRMICLSSDDGFYINSMLW